MLGIILGTGDTGAKKIKPLPSLLVGRDGQQRNQKVIIIHIVQMQWKKINEVRG